LRLNPFRKKDQTDALKALTGTPEVLEALAARQLQPFRSLGGTNIDTQRISSVFVQHQSASYAYLYTHQPAVRSTIDYLARNTAQLGLKVYERISDDERRHAGDHPAARALRNPNEQTPGQQFVFNLMADFLIYDNAYVIKLRQPGSDKLGLINVPPSAVGILGQQKFVAEGYRFYRDDGTFFDLPVGDVLHWRGYDPEHPRMGVSKLETLREELAADAAARSAKTELDRAGLAPRGWLERPVEAPQMTPEAIQRLRETWSSGGGRATRLLEDGTQFKQSAISPEQAQLLDSRKFTKEEVREEFGFAGIPQTEEEREAFYTDVLPPYCEMLCAYIDLSILVGEYGADDYYTAFNLDEKRMGNDRLKAITSAIGAPPFTRNEGRALLDLPPVEGGDEIITALNVLVGDPTKAPKPSTDVMPIQDPNKPSQDGDHREEPKQMPAAEFAEKNDLPVFYKPNLDLEEKELQEDLEAKAIDYNRANPPVAGPEVKALPPGFQISVPKWEDRFQQDFNRQQRYVDEAKGVVARMYKRQANVLRHKSGAKVDMDRWNREHSDDLFALLASIVEREGGLYTARLAGDDFDMRFVQNYLKATSEAAAERMNEITQETIDARGLEAALDEVQGERGDRLAVSMGVRGASFARLESAKRFAPNPERRLKVWVADTDRHSNLNGAAVPLDQDWGGIVPGSLPNCKCSMTIQ